MFTIKNISFRAREAAKSQDDTNVSLLIVIQILRGSFSCFCVLWMGTVLNICTYSFIYWALLTECRGTIAHHWVVSSSPDLIIGCGRHCRWRLADTPSHATMHCSVVNCTVTMHCSGKTPEYPTMHSNSLTETLHCTGIPDQRMMRTVKKFYRGDNDETFCNSAVLWKHCRQPVLFPRHSAVGWWSYLVL